MQTTAPILTSHEGVVRAIADCDYYSATLQCKRLAGIRMTHPDFALPTISEPPGATPFVRQAIKAYNATQFLKAARLFEAEHRGAA